MPLSDWFGHSEKKITGVPEDKRTVPRGIWSKCAHCGHTVYQKDILENLHVCPECNYHFHMTPEERLASLLDPDTFRATANSLVPLDPLKFMGRKPYRETLKKARVGASDQEAITTGRGTIAGTDLFIGVMDFRFIAGSMGSVVGEKVARLFEDATAAGLPVITVSSSGGARMQEGVLSLMQMAKTAAALERHNRSGLPYISVLANPTTGGVLASFASLGDIIIAEPSALIGFAGPRVIQQTLGEELPKGFQRSESLLEHGMIDMIVDRRELRKKLVSLLAYLEPRRGAEL